MAIDFPKSWELQPIADCMSAIIDYRGKSPRKTTTGIPLITAKIVKGGRILPAEEFIAPGDYDSWMRRGMPEPGDILLTTEAPLGEVAQLGEGRVALAQRLITLRGKAGTLDNTFLKFVLQSDFAQDQLRARGTGTTVHGIRQSELRKVELPIPPFEEQRAIAHILGTLDEKIELNRRMNVTLEALARAVFKSWFVDFDPVHAKASGRQPFGMDAQTAALFPGSFEDSSLGEIPKGWRVGNLGELAESPRRVTSPSDISPSTPYIGLEHMPRKSIALATWGRSDEVTSGKSAFLEGEILFGKLRPYFHKVGVAPLAGVCSTDIVVVKAQSPEWYGLALGHLSSKEFVDHADAVSTGTKMPRTSWHDMARYEICVPDRKLADTFGSFVKTCVTKIRQNIHESQTLASIRDALLPKLISGEMRIGDEYS